MMLALLAQVPRHPTYRHVANARFAYAVDVPTFLVAGREPENGDGRAYTSRDGTIELRVYGSYFLSGAGDAPKLADGFRAALAGARRRGKVRLAVSKPGFFALSWAAKGRIEYQRTIALVENGFATVVLSYPASKRLAMDPVVTRVSRSLRALER